MVARMANYHARLAAAEQRTRNVWRAGMDSSVQLTMVELGPGQATNTTEQARHEFSSSPFLILQTMPMVPRIVILTVCRFGKGVRSGDCVSRGPPNRRDQTDSLQPKYSDQQEILSMSPTCTQATRGPRGGARAHEHHMGPRGSARRSPQAPGRRQRRGVPAAWLAGGADGM